MAPRVSVLLVVRKNSERDQTSVQIGYENSPFPGSVRPVCIDGRAAVTIERRLIQYN